MAHAPEIGAIKFDSIFWRRYSDAEKDMTESDVNDE